MNNVGKAIEYPMYLGEIPEDELWDIIIVNNGATTLMTHMIIEGMKRRGKGAIVNVSSAASLLPLGLLAVYSASKSFVSYFSEAIRDEYSKFGITVQYLTPFFVKTQMTNHVQLLQVM